MTDRGSFQVSTDHLREHAKVWRDHAADADAAYTKISPSIGMGDDLGYLAGLHGVKEMFNQWTRAMGDCLQDASQSFTYLEAALHSVANDYDGTDATVATDMSRLDPMNNVR